MGTFGYTTQGALNIACEDQIVGSEYTCPEDTTAKSITVYCRTWTTTPKVKCAIFDDDLKFVAETEEKQLTENTDDWIEFLFSTPPSLTKDALYWLVVWADAYCRTYMDAGSTNQQIRDSETYDSWPDTLVATSYGDYKSSIYCTYPGVINIGKPLICKPLICPELVPEPAIR